MPILVNCPSCATKYNAPDSAAGKAIKCKKCATTIKIENATDQQIQDWLGSPSEPSPQSSSPVPPLIQVARSKPLDVPHSEWSLPKRGSLRIFAPLSVVLATAGFVYWPAGILGLSIATGCLTYYEIMNPAQARLGKVFAVTAIAIGGLAFAAELVTLTRRSTTVDIATKVAQPESTFNVAPSATASTRLPTVETPLAPMAEDVTLEFSVETGDGCPFIHGTTNLPPGTELGASVSDARTDGQIYIGQGQCIVTNAGTFYAGPFSKQSESLAGEFIASVTMPIPAVQSPKVQAIIGENGQHLRGPLVKPTEVLANQVVVAVEKRFIVGGPNATAHQERSLIDNLERSKELYRELEQLGKEVLAARRRAFTHAEWGRFIRSFNTRIEDVISRIEQLDQRTRFGLGVAAGELQLLAMDTARIVLDGKPGRYDPGSFEDDLAWAKTSLDEFARKISVGGETRRGK